MRQTPWTALASLVRAPAAGRCRCPSRLMLGFGHPLTRYERSVLVFQMLSSWLLGSWAGARIQSRGQLEVSACYFCSVG